MGRLDVLVDSFVEQTLKESKTPAEKTLLRDALVRDVTEEVKKQLSAKERAALKADLKKLEQAERARLKRGRIAGFIVEALVLAFLVGMLVNQCTNLIELARAGMGLGEVGLTLGLIGILLLLIVCFLFVQMGIRFKDEDDTNAT